MARAIPKNTLKTKFDNWNSYHALPIHPDDRHLTTFITPYGRYRYRVGPQGYSVTGDAYTSRFDTLVAEIERKVQCVDDSCLWDTDIEQAFFHAVEWIHTCAVNGVTLNPKKFEFAKDTIEFAGFEITPDSVRPCQESLNAILNFPRPTNITDVRSWYGLLNQVAYAFCVADHMRPFRHLMKPGTPFVWTDELEELFEQSKRAIVNEIEEGVRIYDKSKPTCLATDWSKEGIGFWLYQKHCLCSSTHPQCCPTGWKVAMVGSRFTQQAESNYAPIEGEALAVTYALEKAKFFVLGCKDLTIAVDHKPLLGVFNDRSLDMPNRRLRNLKEKSLPYHFKMIHIAGLKNKTADALSRHPVVVLPGNRPDVEAASAEYTSHCPWRHFLAGIYSVEAVNSLKSLHAITWNDVKVATNSDQDMRTLVEFIEQGFPDLDEPLPPALRPYKRFKDDLYAVDGVALYGSRIIIPPALREDILDILHAAHQGVTSMLSMADSTVFWPGITPAITKRRKRCHDCNRNAPSQPSAPPVPTIQPTYPFQAICADYFLHQGKHYLAIVDRYSNYPIAERAKNGAKGLIKSLKRLFATFGIPDEISTDGGSEFVASSTKSFLRTWGVDHRLSSVAFPHSNCRAEIGVKTIKRMITSNTSPTGELDTDAFRVAMLQYRNTPDPETKVSPAVSVFGKPVKNFIPVLPGRYEPHPTWKDTLDRREEALRVRHMKAQERWSEHTKRLPPLKVGDLVCIQNQVGHHPTKWDKTGVVVEVHQFDQYIVRVDGSGRVTLRNRKFLRQYMPMKARRAPLSIDVPKQPTLPQHTPQLQGSKLTSVPPGASRDKASLPLPYPKAPTVTPPEQLSTSLTSQGASPLVQDTISPVNETPLALPTTPTKTPTTTKTSSEGASPDLTGPTRTLSYSDILRTPTKKKVPLALRRLASHNPEGRKGLGEYKAEQ